MHSYSRLLSASDFSDDEFNQLVSSPARDRAAEYWTPVMVARRVARRFAKLGAKRVLDVGCGIGKFCLAAAAAEPGIQWHGVERRPQLIQAALAMRDTLGLDNVSFSCADAFEESWNGFDGLYFFNPFSENLASESQRFDGSVELSVERFLRETSSLCTRLDTLRAGTFLLTYHGIGGPIPASYEILSDESVATGRLRTWRRTATASQPWLHIETNDGVYCAKHEEFHEAAQAAVRSATALKGFPSAPLPSASSDDSREH